MANAFNIKVDGFERVVTEDRLLYKNEEVIEINSTEKQIIFDFKMLYEGKVALEVSGKVNEGGGDLRLEVKKNGELLTTWDFTNTSYESRAIGINVNKGDEITVEAYMTETGYSGVISVRRIEGVIVPAVAKIVIG